MASKPARFIKVEGLSIRIWSNSEASSLDKSKPTIVFFHGYSFSLDDWLRIGTLQLLTEKGYPVLAIDLPSGKATKSDRVAYDDFGRYVALLEKIFEKAGLRDEGGMKRPINLVGPSMGGTFALSYALAHPSEVESLILIAPVTSSIEEERFGELEMPVLLVWGEEDSMFPVDEYARELKNKLGHSKLLIIKGAGHAAYLDQPEEFNELLLDFLEEIF